MVGVKFDADTVVFSCSRSSCNNNNNNNSNGQNTGKSAGDLRRLAATQTPKDHLLKLM